MRRSLALGTVFLALHTVVAWPAPLPQRIGQCASTAIKNLSYRLDGIPDSGSAVAYANGGTQVSYDVIPAIHRSRRGDPVRLCLVSIPRGCPPGDDRGRTYKATNLRTGESWSAPDAQHICGGA